MTIALLLAAAGVLPAEPVKSSVLESNIIYFQANSAGKDLLAALQSIPAGATNRIIGIILDLRFAAGTDIGASRSAADVLAGKKLPLAVLVNTQTAGAATALAKDLQESHSALVFGNATAEVKPDVAVSVAATDEKEFLENPYGMAATNRAPVASAKTNEFLPIIDHTSEADLVRARIKDGEDDSNLQPERLAEPPAPFIRDPVLARGIDFIKGVSILRLSRS